MFGVRFSGVLLVLTWPMAKRLQLFGITYLVGKIKQAVVSAEECSQILSSLYEIAKTGVLSHHAQQVASGEASTRPPWSAKPPAEPEPVKVPQHAEVQVPQQEGQDGQRKAQTVTGELLWLSIRTRPDIAFVVGVMGRWSTKNPAMVLQLGADCISYLYGTRHVGLIYGVCEESSIFFSGFTG